MRSTLHCLALSLATTLALYLPPVAAGEPLTLLRIERPGLKPSHLVVLPEARNLSTPARDQLESLLAEARLLVMEMDLDPAALLSALPTALETDTNRRTRVEPVLYRRAVSQLRARGADGRVVSRLRPWALGLALDAPPRGEESVELHLLREASTRHIKVRALESLSERAADLDGMATADQERMIRAALARGEKAPILMRDLLDAWRAGNGHRLQELLLAAQRKMGPYQSEAHAARLAGRLSTVLGDGGALVLATPPMLDPRHKFTAILRARGWTIVSLSGGV